MRASVPASIYQIRLTCGSLDATQCVEPGPQGRWPDYAQRFGYGYRLWTLDDLPEMLPMLDVEAAHLVTQALAVGKLAYASEVLRVAVLNRLGGIFVGNAVEPPCSEGAWGDLRQLVPMAGLVASTASEGRNVGTSAVLLATDFLLAPAAHPVLAHLVASFAANHDAWVRRHPPFDAQYAAGIFAFNRALSGAFAVVPRTFLERLEMTRPPSAALAGI